MNKFEDGLQALEQDEFVRAYYLTHRYTTQKGTSAIAHQLQGLLAERLDMSEEAAASFSKAVQVLETEYETTESTEVEERYIIANSSLGRAYLACRRDEEAISALDAALGLLQDREASAQQVQCLLLKGLALHFKGDIEASLQAFEDAQSALQAANASNLQGQSTLLLAKVLCSLGGEEQRSEAERQLLDK
jgi:superkiller protein 3